MAGQALTSQLTCRNTHGCPHWPCARPMIPTPCSPDAASTQVLGLGEDLRLAYMGADHFPWRVSHPGCPSEVPRDRAQSTVLYAYNATPHVRSSSRCAIEMCRWDAVLCIQCSPTCAAQTCTFSTVLHAQRSPVCADMQNTMKTPRCCLCNSPGSRAPAIY